jgi:hypothetical protein
LDDVQPHAEELLRLTFRPRSVRARGVAISKRDTLDGRDEVGYTQRPLASGGFLIRVRHSGAGEVEVIAPGS